MNNLVNYDKVKYQFEKSTIVPGIYTLHRPSQCNLKFPKGNRPIHKKLKNAYEGKETIELFQNSKFKHMLLPNKEKSVYPVISHKNYYKKLQKLTEPRYGTENAGATKLKEINEDADKLKEEFRAKQKPQPGIEKKTVDNTENDLNTSTKIRALNIQCENLQGARFANRFILASKCHAIRDAQVAEKAVIVKQLEEEDRRMDKMMEEARVAALEIEQKKHEETKARRLENINTIKKQISEHENAKIMRMERHSKESNRVNQVGMAIFKDESDKLKLKRENEQRLMKLLQKCNEELKYSKQRQMEEDKIMEERIEKFQQEKLDRENKYKMEERKKKFERERGIFFIANAQESAKKYLEDMENIRVLRVQEDVERKYRESEKIATLKKIKGLETLKEARKKQIEDIRLQIAMEIARDEEVFNNVLKRIEENDEKEQEEMKRKQQALKKHREFIIKQINEKERKRIQTRKMLNEEGIAMTLEIERMDKLEKDVVRRKVEEMREQKIPEIYVNEVENRLAKTKLY